MKFMTSQAGQQKNTIHILPNISKNKGNQTVKFEQLLEYKMRNIFFEKVYTKHDASLPKYINTKGLTTYFDLI